jgi:3-oxoacyl-[acyl-carrier protein] reductase
MHEDLERAFDLTGRVAVITGAAGGIGRQAAITFAQAGARLVLADQDVPGAEETALRAARTATGVESIVVTVDTASKESVDGLAAAAARRFGGIDIWANVAGILRRSLIIDTSVEEYETVMRVNLAGVFWGSAAAARVMREGSGGSIINIASSAADVAAPELAVYGASKAAVMYVTRTLAAEVGRWNIRANSIAPGFIETGMTAHSWTRDGSVDEERRQEVLANRAGQSVLGITGRPSDISHCMLYLASDASRFMTGQVLRPEGGVVMV